MYFNYPLTPFSNIWLTFLILNQKMKASKTFFSCPSLNLLRPLETRIINTIPCTLWFWNSLIIMWLAFFSYVGCEVNRDKWWHSPKLRVDTEIIMKDRCLWSIRACLGARLDMKACKTYVAECQAQQTMASQTQLRMKSQITTTSWKCCWKIQPARTQAILTRQQHEMDYHKLDHYAEFCRNTNLSHEIIGCR